MLAMKKENEQLWIRAGGARDASPSDSLVPTLERVAGCKSGAVPAIIESTPDFAHWHIGGLCSDLRFDVGHKVILCRNSIVGDSRWDGRGAKLFDPLFHAGMKFFQSSERRAVEEWARAGGRAS
ncbi:MAG: STAS/SEC14 domain-containing protein [Erythrobacteraceae bacterium]|jgi:hypothetical protein|nr:STAS/SEC14 domain-containing protein [Erythrobacter sp.]PCH79500.1 MAG: STAS/SEC14 domain-containing protein [Erythrobacteraceae bacterium]